LRGIKKEAAFHYSFLLSIPAIVGAMGIELREAILGKNLPHQTLPWMIGALSAFLVGYVSLVLLRKALLKKKFFLFAIYCWAMGAGLIIMQWVSLYSLP
jgi:undecaprenyl-diphosphatase